MNKYTYNDENSKNNLYIQSTKRKKNKYKKRMMICDQRQNIREKHVRTRKKRQPLYLGMRRRNGKTHFEDINQSGFHLFYSIHAIHDKF